ncbi:Isoquinoline 1-oxidoreductase subunit [Bradyrhizobium sp. 83012]|uniref:Isoquinoline 1-oxidoreductase subunit n=1 Tax=Bradyrhizobium aeschynomenes TaxID=2734909 RepID=A0ABX2C5C8_9BRAD|nr:Isoquinoline 1-oxidoreductase subunit [Bradyrhizobium aeschynomenes]NPU63497.1 Isoquinoline 1-oxidoreductase subunit [Bradyrhizobium aeschynomenes]NPV19499.1 Isoquinoline 1-oxidoreductase subunit [Bradyrhizobium aeschynomenes]
MRVVGTGTLALLAGSLAAVAIAAYPGLRRADAAPEAVRMAAGLKPVTDFARIKNKDERAVALFEEAGKVLQSPRCMNCHPAGDRPTQTDKMLPHQPLVVRGEAGMGAPGGLVCTTCHHEANFDAARVPGNPKWQLAPIEMAWQGRSLGQICAQIKDSKLNGGKTMAQLVHHMAEDELVGWGWNPGAGRTPAPGTQKQFGELIKAWADAGAACPKG